MPDVSEDRKRQGEVGKGGRENHAKPWGGQRTARNRGVAQVNGREGGSKGTAEPSGPVGGADLSPLWRGWGVGEGSGRAWALLCPQPSLTQPTHQDTLPYTLSSEVSCIP